MTSICTFPNEKKKKYVVARISFAGQRSGLLILMFPTALVRLISTTCTLVLAPLCRHLRAPIHMIDWLSHQAARWAAADNEADATGLADFSSTARRPQFLRLSTRVYRTEFNKSIFPEWSRMSSSQAINKFNSSRSLL